MALPKPGQIHLADGGGPEEDLRLQIGFLAEMVAALQVLGGCKIAP